MTPRIATIEHDVGDGVRTVGPARLTDLGGGHFLIEYDLTPAELDEYHAAEKRRRTACDATPKDARARIVERAREANLGCPAAVIAAALKVLDISPEEDAAVMNWDPES